METSFGIGIYKKEDYQEIFKLSEDQDNMDETWKKWKVNKETAIKNFLAIGIKPVDILVTPEELVKYCRKNGVPLNGESRASFISYKFSELDK